MQIGRTSVEGAWLNSKDLRYAVLFNPAVATQRTHGFEEEEWWQSKPSLRYSALDLQKPNRTLSINGKIPMNRLMWLQLESSNGETMRSVEVFVDDVNADTCIEVVAPCSTGNSSEHVIAIEDLRAGRRGWVRIAISDQEPLKGIRIMSPRGKGSYSIGGLRFGIDRLRWPWNSKANMIAQPRVGDTTPVKVSFDPQKLMPSMLKGRKLTVLDDNGSSVLIRIAPSQEN